jgi:anaerobic magnesium-protoporphyrin IX monomethyl ester cyclase
MARLVLVVPPAAEPLNTPLLGVAYLAAALSRAGHTPLVIDAASPAGPHDPDAVLALARALEPDLVGLHLKTAGLRQAYEVGARLRALDVPLVAGGPHATAAPGEVLEHGFDAVCVGEAESTLVELADGVDAGRGVTNVTGVVVPGQTRVAARALEPLDTLASPFDALRLFDPAWYRSGSRITFGGVISSRGCPCSCTFCHSGRAGSDWRHQGHRRVLEDIRALIAQCGQSAFNFFDDSFATSRKRVHELCASLRDVRGIAWTASAHPSHLDRDMIRAMRDAGCRCIDLGVESGSAARLALIRKGIALDRVLGVIDEATLLGVGTVVNLMFGWPDETESELDETLAFMDACAERGAIFGARGVLVPLPGTALYQQHHRRYGFTDWWLAGDEPWRPAPAGSSLETVYTHEPALDRNFFGLAPALVDKIRVALARKAAYTVGRLGVGAGA